MVREDQIAAAALDVEPETDAAQSDCCALDMPAGPAGAERRRPARLARALYPPQQRVERIGLSGSLRVSPALGEQPQHGVAVVVGLVPEHRVGVGTEVHVGVLRVVDDVGRAGRQQLLHHFDHLVDGLGGGDVVLGRQHPQGGHVGAEQIGLPGAQVAPVDPVPLGPFEQRVVDVGDVLDVVHPVAVVEPHPVDQIEGQVGGGMAEVGGVVGRDPADVHGRRRARHCRPDLPVGAVVEPQLGAPARHRGNVDGIPGAHQLACHMASSSTPAISGRHISKSGR